MWNHILCSYPIEQVHGSATVYLKMSHNDCRADYVVLLIKSRDVVPKNILGGNTLAVCTNFLPKLLHYITLGRHSNTVIDAVFIFVCFP